MNSIKEYYLRSHGLLQVIETIIELPTNVILIKIVKHRSHISKIFIDSNLSIYSTTESKNRPKIIQRIEYKKQHDPHIEAAIARFLKSRPK